MRSYALSERYYLDGYTLVGFDPTKPATQRLAQVVNRLLTDQSLPPGFSWESQGSSITLRPNVFDYDSAFLDVLFENEIPAKLQAATAKRLTLVHIQAVRTKPGPSYADWHRDTHFYEGEPLAGNLPPVHKIIFYPQRFDYKEEERLHVLRTSHRTMVDNKEIDFSLIQSLPIDTVTTSNERAILFDTSLFHAVVPDSHPGGSIRVMYTFMTFEQYYRTYASKPLHSRLNVLYEGRITQTEQLLQIEKFKDDVPQSEATIQPPNITVIGSPLQSH